MLPLLAGAAVLASAVGRRRRKDSYTIGVSNTVQGNGWREEMICAIKAQALASGKVAKLNIAHRNTDAAGQLEDIRNLISAGVDAIVVNPADPAGINAALEEATKAGIVVVAVDQAVTEPSAYIISNNQEQYAYLGAKWLFEQIGGKGDVVYMRGAAGASADSDRDKGFKKALAEYPGRQGRARGLHRLAAGPGQAADPRLHRHRHAVQRHLDLRHRQRHRRRAGRVAAHAGAGRRRRQCRLRRPAQLGQGPVGRGGHQPRLDRRRRRDAGAADPRRQEAGAADRAGRAASCGRTPPTTARPSSQGRADPSLSPEWPVSISIPDWTTYTKDQIVACKGPGE